MNSSSSRREENFDSLFSRLDPKLQTFVSEHAQRNVPFDEILADCRAERPERVERWLALKAWSKRQPWYAEAMAAPKPVPWTEEQTAAWMAAAEAEAYAKFARFHHEKRIEEGDSPEAVARSAELADSFEVTARGVRERAEAILPPKRK